MTTATAGHLAAADGPTQLPAGWRLARLDDLCERQTGIRDPRELPDTPFRYVDISSVDNVRKRIGEVKTVLGKDAPSRARQIIRSGDVLVATTRPNLNAVARVPPELDGQICSTGFCVLRPGTELLGDYLFAFVQHPAFVRRLSDMVKGALYPAVTDGQVRSLRIPLPPLAEQRRIVAVLSEKLAAVEKARAAGEERLRLAKMVPAASLRASFCGSEVKEWPIERLGHCAEVVSGITLGRKLRQGPTRRVPYLRVANVKDGYLDLADVYEIEATEEEIDKLRLCRGDLLLTEGGDRDKLGRGTFWEEQIPECLHQNHIFRVRLPAERFVPAFVAAQFGSPYGKAYFLRHAKQTTGIACINQRVLRAFPLMVPPHEVQLHVAAAIENDAAVGQRIIDAATEELRGLGLLRSSLLRRAFAGGL